MPTSTCVKLIKDCEPIFPDRCVGCMKNRPETTHRVTSSKMSLLSAFLLQFGDFHTVYIPTCSSCRRRIRLQFWLRIVLFITALITAAAVAKNHLPNHQGLLRTAIVFGVGAAVALPLGILHVLFAPAFQITVTGNAVQYEFRYWYLAEEFEALNSDHVCD